MAKISAAKKAQFPEPDLETFVVANTERAYEVLGPRDAEHPHCVVCGSPLKDVFVTSYGPMGGDCFSTLSGDPTTRKAYRKLMKLFDHVAPWGSTQWSLWNHQILSMRIEAQRDFHGRGSNVGVRFVQYDSESMRQYERTVGYVPEQPGVTEYLEGWAAEHHIPVQKNNPVLVARQEVSEPRAATLRRLESNDPEGFMDWAEQYEDDEETLQANLDDPETRLDMIADWIQEWCSLSVSDLGLVEFWQLFRDDDCNVREVVGGAPVAVYHHTVSGALKGIREQGGLVPAIRLGKKPTKHNSGAYVFVTTETSGPVIDGYVHRARQRFGGDHVILTIRSTLYDLEPDPDDADISTGRRQFVLDRVPLTDIVEVEPKRYAKALLREGRSPKNNPVRHTSRPLVVVHLSSLDAYTDEAVQALGREKGLRYAQDLADSILRYAMGARMRADAKHDIVVMDQGWDDSAAVSGPRRRLEQQLTDLGATFIPHDEDAMPDAWRSGFQPIIAAVKKMGSKDVDVVGLWCSEAGDGCVHSTKKRLWGAGIKAHIVEEACGFQGSAWAERDKGAAKPRRIGRMQRTVLEAVSEHGDPYHGAEDNYTLWSRRQTVAFDLLKRKWLALLSHLDPRLTQFGEKQWRITDEGKRVLKASRA